MSNTFEDGKVVQSGTVTVGWDIRQWDTGASVQYDWIVDDGRGGYTESDEFFETIGEALASLGRK